MNKAEMVALVSSETGLTKADVGRCLEALLAQVTKSLKRGNRVTLVGFGSFAVSRRRARQGRNPRSGETIRIAARKVPRFTAGKELKAAVR